MIHALARDPGTDYPSRVGHVLAALARKAAAPAVEAPPWAVPSIAYVESGRRRCPDHRDYPADNCAQHRKDAEIAALEAEQLAARAAAVAEPVEQVAPEVRAALRAQLARRAPIVAAQRGKPAGSEAPDVDRAVQLARLAELQAADAVA